MRLRPQEVQEEEDKEQLWRECWGSAQIPEALQGLEVDAFTTALAWLLHKRASPGGIGHLGKVAGYVAQDLAQGKRAVWRGWTLQDLLAVRDGATPPEVQARIERRASEARAVASRPEYRTDPPDQTKAPQKTLQEAREGVIRWRACALLLEGLGEAEAWAQARAERDHADRHPFEGLDDDTHQEIAQ